jgi:hypothetical protein
MFEKCELSLRSGMFRPKVFTGGGSQGTIAPAGRALAEAECPSDFCELATPVARAF